MMTKTKSLLLTVCSFSTALVADDYIRFDVKLPKKISMKKQLTYTISFTNISKNPILVPDFILGGMGIYYWYDMYDEHNNHLMPGIHYEYLFSREAVMNKPSLLPPGETRSEDDWWDSKDFFPKPGRYRIVFHWKGRLDDNRDNKPKQFSCEKWIIVTE